MSAAHPGASGQEIPEPFRDLPGVHAAFLLRVPEVDVAVEREEALRRLRPAHERLTAQLGFSAPVLAEQIHDRKVAVVRSAAESPIAGVDGLITATPGLTLGIYAADCAAIFLFDRKRRVIGLLHSGRRGTELNILGAALDRMRAEFGTNAADVTGAISPCIRPPHYETDFAARIAQQARVAGMVEIHDPGACTAANPDRYYSYRREKGLTGRMLALLALTE